MAEDIPLATYDSRLYSPDFAVDLPEEPKEDVLSVATQGQAGYAEPSITAVPEVQSLLLQTTSGHNLTTDDLTLNISLYDGDSDPVFPITDFRRDNESFFILQYHFDENVSSNATGAVREYSTWAMNATLGSGTASTQPTWRDTGKFGGAYYFDGGDHIMVEGSEVLNVSDKLSFFAWINITTYTAWQRVMGKFYSPDYEVNSTFFLIISDQNTTICYINYEGSGYTEVRSLPNTLTEGEWIHVGCVYDGNSLKNYINGVVSGSTNIAGRIIESYNFPITIGTTSNGVSYQNKFQGLIDNVFVSNLALSLDEVQQLYSQGYLDAVSSGVTSPGEEWTVAVTPSANGDIGNTTISNMVTIASVVNITSCGQSLANNTVYTLTSDITSAGSTCLDLTGLSQVHITCSGYSINGTDTADTYGILADGASNITISGCIIRDYDRAIWINNVTDIAITTTTLRSNTVGLLLNSTAGGSYRDVIADNNGEGIVILNGQGNLFTFVNVSASTTYGIRHLSSTDTVFNMSINEHGYNGSSPKLYSTAAFSPLSMYNRGFWPLYDENGSSVLTVNDAAWYSGTYGGRNPDGSTNLSLRFYRSYLNSSLDPNPGYSDVLLITIHNSVDSVNISQYFIDQRGIQHVLEVYLPNPGENMPYVVLETQVINPIKDYLRDYNGSINYYVLTKGMPTVTSEPGYPDVGSNYNQSSVDSEIALINSDWESSMGGKGKVTNPYYNWSSFFSTKFSGNSYTGRASFSSEGYGGVRLVTRLDGFTVADAKALLDRASYIRRNDLFNSTAIVLNVIGAFSTDVVRANATLSSKGVNVILNTSTSSSPTAQIPNIPYRNISYVEFYQHNSFSPEGLPNITFINGSIALPRYSWAGKSVNPAWSGSVDALAADMIAMGSTFVYASATEPFTSGSYESSILARDFVEGYYFADTVWNAIPHLSWSTTLFGDPKGTFPMAYPSVVPAAATNYSDLACSVTLIHPSGRWMNITSVWYKNGVLQGNLTANLTGIETGSTVIIGNVTSGNLSVGENWTCGISTYVKGTFSFEFLASNVTIIYNNSIPVVTDVGITPSSPTPDDLLEGSCTSADSDVQNHSYSYKWYKNNVLAITVSNPAIPALGWSVEMDNSAYDDELEFIINTPDGGMVSGGSSVPHIFPSPTVPWAMKTDSSGEQVWNYTLDRGTYDSLYAAILTDDGSIVLVGGTFDILTFDSDFLIMKLDSGGSLLWDISYDLQANDFANAILQTPDGGLLVAGYSAPMFGTTDGWIIRLNASGGLVWNRTVVGSNTDTFDTILLTEQQDYLLWGHTDSFQAQGLDAWVVRINDSGTVLMNQTYGGSGTEYVWDAIETSDNGYLVVGETNTWGAGNKDVWLMKLNSSLDVEWNTTYGGSALDRGYGVVEGTNGGYLVTGVTYSFGNGLSDLWVMRVNTSGGLVWNLTLGTADDEEGNAIIATQDGLVTVGYKESTGGASTNFWLVKINEEGSVQETNESYPPGVSYTLATVLASETTLDDSWIFSCRANDRMNLSAWYNSSSVTVSSESTEEEDSTTVPRRRTGWLKRSNRTFVEHSWGRLPTGYNLSWELGHPDIGITWIKHGVRKRINQAYLSVERHRLWPAGLKVPQGAFYQLFEINRKLYTDEQTGMSMVIEFEVSSKWQQANNLDPKDVVLKRFTDLWTYLPTRLIGQGSDVLTYEALTPGFSYFVIGEKMAETEEVTLIPTGAEDTILVVPPPTRQPDREGPELEPPEKEARGKGLLWIFLVILVGGMIGFVILFIAHKDRAANRITEEAPQPRAPTVHEEPSPIVSETATPTIEEPSPISFVDAAPPSFDKVSLPESQMTEPEKEHLHRPEPTYSPAKPSQDHLQISSFEEPPSEPDQPVKSWIPAQEHEAPLVIQEQLDYREHFLYVIDRADAAIAMVNRSELKKKQDLFPE